MPMVGRYEEIPVETMNSVQKSIHDGFMGSGGRVPTPFRMFLASPELATRMRALAGFVVRDGSLTNREVELSILVIAHQMKSNFVMGAHRKNAAKAGWPQDIIDGACSGKDVSSLIADARERAVYEVARAMAVNTPAPMDKFQHYTKTLGHNGIVELVALLGFYCTCAFTVGFYDVPPSP